jgi:tripartite-type tricarboxylate transporter receptor subunit TctC
MIAPPGTPQDRVKLLREAYAKSLKDENLLQEAKKGKMEVEPVSGEELQKLAETIVNQPPEVIARVKKVLGQ